jgi:hypothetical protein
VDLVPPPVTSPQVRARRAPAPPPRPRPVAAAAAAAAHHGPRRAGERPTRRPAPPQSNAAVGVPTASLAGGCACCTVHGDLLAALKQLAAQASSSIDYLVGAAAAAAADGLSSRAALPQPALN